MIESMCACGTPLAADEAKVNTVIACKKCRAMLLPVSAEPLAGGAGAGDFDARLTITDGPDSAGEQIFLGGVADLEIGKLAERHIVLGGTKVSRFHCKLSRVDFGPSRWKLVDNRSTNGVFVNGSRTTEYDLDTNDEITIGEYTLKYETDVAPPPPPPPSAATKTIVAPRITGAPMAGTLAYAGPPTLSGITNQRLASRAVAESSYGLSNTTLIVTGAMVGLPLLLLILAKVIPSLELLAAVIAIMSAATLWLWGHIGILVTAFTEGSGCGLMCMFVPFYQLYFTLTRLDETKMHVLRIIAAVVLVAAAMTLAPGAGS